MTCFFRSFELIRNVSTSFLSRIAVSKRTCRLLLVLFAALVPLQTSVARMVDIPPEVGDWQYFGAGQIHGAGGCMTITGAHFNQPRETTGVYNYQPCTSGATATAGESCAIDETIELKHRVGLPCPRPVFKLTSL